MLGHDVDHHRDGFDHAHIAVAHRRQEALALDGGHVMFLLYEMVSGRKPSDKFLEGAQKVGMVLLLSLMVFVIFNDIFKAIF